MFSQTRMRVCGFKIYFGHLFQVPLRTQFEGLELRLEQMVPLAELSGDNDQHKNAIRMLVTGKYSPKLKLLY